MTFVFSALLEYALVNYALRADVSFARRRRQHRRSSDDFDDDEAAAAYVSHNDDNNDDNDNDAYRGRKVNNVNHINGNVDEIVSADAKMGFNVRAKFEPYIYLGYIINKPYIYLGYIINNPYIYLGYIINKP